MANKLVRYDAMCRAIDAAHKVDEVKDIRDQAVALQTYARQAMNTDAERRAAEIRLRAERKCGQLLEQTADAKPGPKGKSGRKDRPNSIPTLAQLGITKDQSSQWQRLGRMSQEEFDCAIGVNTKPPTTNGVLRTVESPKRRLVDPSALWLWGRLLDFERDGLLDKSPADLIETMTEPMKDDVHRLAPKVAAWLKTIGALS